jgi:hypothetical protein
MTLFFDNHEITIYRSRRKTGTDRYAMSATLTSYPADIQPASIERTESVPGRIGNIFDAFVEQSVDVKEGDQIVASGKRYSVRGVSNWQGAGLLDHKELTLESLDG